MQPTYNAATEMKKFGEPQGEIAVKHAIRFMVLATAALLVLVGRSVGRSETTPAESKSEGKQGKPTIVGSWRVDSVSMTLPGGKRRTLSGRDGPASATISEKAFTLRVGRIILMDMSYVLDPAPAPWAIDLQSPAGVMLGICVRDGDELKISLSDEAKGRPRDFNKENSGMVFVLRRVHGQPLFVISADGSNLHQLSGTPDSMSTGSPDWSHDGKRIAFDGWQSAFGENWGQAHVWVINADGRSPRDLGPGAMPSWSPDDKQLTYCQYGPEGGVWIMNADGSARRQIDAEGWGSQWSPKRNEIAYTVHAGGAALCIHDVAKNKPRELLQDRYRQIYWGLTWSPDGKWICLKGVLSEGGCEIAAVSAEGEKKGFKVLLPSSALPEVGNAACTMAWGGTGNQILVYMQTKTDRAGRLYVLDFTGAKPPQLFPKFPAGWESSSMAWSPDGKRVVLSAEPAWKR
jgi:TolB protein